MITSSQLSVYFYGVALAFVLTACSDNKKKSKPEQEAISVDTLMEDSTLTKEPFLNKKPEATIPRTITKEDLSVIKSSSSPRSQRFTIPDFDNRLKNIPEDFLEKYLYGLPVSFSYTKELPKEYHEAYHFFEFKALDKTYFFSILYDDESCCRNVYGIIVDKINLEIINTAHLGLTGGDGGWQGGYSGVWITDTSLYTTLASVYDNGALIDDNYDEYKIEIDTLWAKTYFHIDGKITYEKIDSVHVEEIIKK